MSPTLRLQYLPQIFEAKMDCIRKELKNSFIYVMVDETTDYSNRQVANVIVGSLLMNDVKKAHLIASRTLVKTDSITSLILQCLSELWVQIIRNMEKYCYL